MTALLWLLDVSVDDPPWQGLDPRQRRQQTLDGVKRVLLRESQVQPVVVVFEDLHWIDAETQALVDALVESLPAARVLLLVNYRPEYQHAWGGKTYYRQLRIDPLPLASAHELLDALLGHDATVQPLKAILIQRTEGTPFFLHSAMALWFLGFPARALERSRTGLAMARELAHLGTLVNELPFAGFVHQLRGDVEATREIAQTVIALSTEHEFQQWLAIGQILEGWAEAQAGPAAAPIARIRRAIDDLRATGNELYIPFFLSLLATAQLKSGQAAEGLDTVIAAQAMADRAGARLLEPELYRLRGQLLLAHDPTAEPDAEIAFRQALDIARRNSMKSWELRAAVSLGRLLLSQGKRDDARGLVTETYGWFTEGFDTADLRDAKTLLEELSAGMI